MTFRGAVRWGLRPKRIAVMVAKLLLAGTTDLAAQTAWQEVNSGVPQLSIHLEAQGPHREVSTIRGGSAHPLCLGIPRWPVQANRFNKIGHSISPPGAQKCAR